LEHSSGTVTFDYAIVRSADIVAVFQGDGWSSSTFPDEHQKRKDIDLMFRALVRGFQIMEPTG
jgi:hypothetical protein